MEGKYLVLVLALVALSHQKSYDGYTLIRLTPATQLEFDIINSLYLDSDIDFWEEPSVVGRPVDIFASPQWLTEIGHMFSYAVLNDHVQTDINEERLRLDQYQAQHASLAYNYNDFNDYETVMAEVDRQVSDFCPSGFDCSIASAGSTIEGEPMRYITITKVGEPNRPAIWIDSTIHAREWLATTTMMWTLRQLVEYYTPGENNPLDTYDFYIMPIVNPDGYKYTHASERLWRKNRRNNAGSSCFGIDLNRNFDFQFGTSGTSTNPCSDTFRGPSAASEPEVANQQNLVNSLMESGVDLKAAISMHTYGQYWLTPYGHQSGGQCAGAPGHMVGFANRVADATQSVYNTNWRRGPICTVLYPASGNTIDYMHGVTGVPATFLPELRGNSFIVSPAFIPLSFNEIWEGLVVIFAEAADL